jgi:hypothetical protein
MQFSKYAKHLRNCSEGPYGYYPQYVERRFNEALKILGSPSEGDYFAFVTLRFMGESDWVVSSHSINDYERRLCGLFALRQPGLTKLPMASSIEHNPYRIKDHAHMIIRFTGPLAEYTMDEMKSILQTTAFELERINHRNRDSVRVRMFPFCEDSYELGNHIEYIYKTCSRHTNTLLRASRCPDLRKRLKTQL